MYVNTFIQGHLWFMFPNKRYKQLFLHVTACLWSLQRKTREMSNCKSEILKTISNSSIWKFYNICMSSSMHKFKQASV